MLEVFPVAIKDLKVFKLVNHVNETWKTEILTQKN